VGRVTRPKGAEPLLTPAAHERIVGMLASGCTVEVAASAVGVRRETLHRWLQRGQEAREAREAGQALPARSRAYLALLDAAEEARSKAEVTALATIQRAARSGSWQAAAWWLERTVPERYAAAKAARRATPGRPVGATSAPDRPPTSAAPPMVLRAVK
jgi:hypothetical protein